ncbi:MAG: hypothetical protein CVU61_07075 [Deltaproteobacteria bacterium HGW-Deltaproteobacteria-19]|jgi:hypothetical protein|nr:MAG: hypothetical protein CVU61_07075 [Deltaproteobacteria bacterium HGW-Deltaproteobacteria-19]
MRKQSVFIRGTLLLAFLAIPALMGGCVYTGGSAMDTHKKGMSSITEEEYFVTKKPVDKAFIGAAWSRQFGPIEDPATENIRTKKERSLSGIQQDFAYNLGIGLGGQLAAGPQAEVGAGGGSAERAKLSGLEIISPVTLADIPFEPKLSYVTEALRLANFRISDEKSNKAGINVGAGTVVGSGTATAEVGTGARRGTEGDGLVVAYKLHMIDPKSYVKQDSGSVPLVLDGVVDFPKAHMIAKTRLQLIDPGTGRSLPRNILWACPRADAKSRDMVAAWVVELRSTDPKRRTMNVAFPAWPAIEECQNFTGVIHSFIDPLTDKINRQKISIMLIDAEVTDNLKPKKWEARVSLIDEAFNIKMVKPADLEAPRQSSGQTN